MDSHAGTAASSSASHIEMNKAEDGASNGSLLLSTSVTVTPPETDNGPPQAIAVGPSSEDTDPQANEATAATPKRADTPTRKKHRYDYEAYGRVEAGRAAGLKDIGTTLPEVELKTFAEDLLPPLDSAHKQKVLGRLRTPLENGGLGALSEDGWANFLGRKPPKDHASETEAFEPFEKVVNQILNASTPSPPGLLYKHTPNHTLQWTIREFKGKPDGYGYLPMFDDEGSVIEQEPGKVLWRQIVVVAEFKKNDTNAEHRNKNVAQVIGDMTQVMSDDPMRRFTYGITIENFTMRMWYSDRRQVVVSQAFDIMTDPEWLVHFVLSIGYPDSPWDIGFDLTMDSTEDPGRFDITVHDVTTGKERTFRTVKLINSVGAEALRGRGTRVWKAREWVGNRLTKKEVALKDVWIDSDRPREGDILNQLLEAVAPGDKDQLQANLLTVVCHGDVLRPKNVMRPGDRIPLEDHMHPGHIPDATVFVEEVGRFPVVIPTGGEAQIAAKSRHTMDTAGSYIDRASTPGDEEVEYDEKTHYRIVFEEVGEPLRDQDSLQVVSHALWQVTDVLSFVHKAGWIHRDISVNNILWYEGRAKLADWEYAKHEDDITSTHTLRTATTYFMAVEAQTGGYRFLETVDPPGLAYDVTKHITHIERKPHYVTPPLVPSHSQSQSQGQTRDVISPDPASGPPFRCNPLHDIESLWWIAVYYIFFRAVEGKQEKQSSADIETQRRNAGKLFNEGAYRYDALSVEGRFAPYMDCIHPSLRQANVHTKIQGLRSELVKIYREAEQDLDGFRFGTIADKLYTHFALTFYTLSLDLRHTHIRPNDASQNETPNRSRSGIHDGGSGYTIVTSRAGKMSLGQSVEQSSTRKRDDQYDDEPGPSKRIKRNH